MPFIIILGGGIIGQPMLAHKATHEAKIAAEVAHGKKVFFDTLVIPSVGETEITAKERGINYGLGKFPWAASGRALGLDRTEGFTKLV